MKLYRRWRALLALALCLIFGVCPTTLAVPDHTAHAGHTALPATTYSARSIYQLESTWMTMTAEPVRLGHLPGNVQELATMNPTCDSARPICGGLTPRLQ